MDILSIKKAVSAIFPVGSEIADNSLDVPFKERFWLISGKMGPRWLIPQKKKYGLPIFMGDNTVSLHQKFHEDPKAHLDYYEQHLTSAMAHPHIVGYNRCQYQNQQAFMNPKFLKEGLVDEYGKIHEGIMPRLGEINRKALKVGYNLYNTGNN